MCAVSFLYFFFCYSAPAIRFRWREPSRVATVTLIGAQRSAFVSLRFHRKVGMQQETREPNRTIPNAQFYNTLYRLYSMSTDIQSKTCTGQSIINVKNKTRKRSSTTRKRVVAWCKKHYGSNPKYRNIKWNFINR